ncbi:MAG: hypothetical protein AAGD07_24205 [Planctomycetota bacterium]
MTEDEARQQLRRVFVVYPSYREAVERSAYGNETLNAWLQILTPCELADVRAVVDEIVRGERPATDQYQKPDQLPRNIASEARDRAGKRREQSRQHSKYHADLSHLRVRDRRFGIVSHEAIRLGGDVRRGRITQEENDDKMAVLRAWLSGDGPEPHWLAQEAKLDDGGVREVLSP